MIGDDSGDGSWVCRGVLRNVDIDICDFLGFLLTVTVSLNYQYCHSKKYLEKSDSLTFRFREYVRTSSGDDDIRLLGDGGAIGSNGCRGDVISGRRCMWSLFVGQLIWS